MRPTTAARRIYKSIVRYVNRNRITIRGLIVYRGELPIGVLVRYDTVHGHLEARLPSVVTARLADGETAKAGTLMRQVGTDDNGRPIVAEVKNGGSK